METEVKPEGLCITGKDHPWKPRATMQGVGRPIAASKYDWCPICAQSRPSPLFEHPVGYPRGKS